MARAHAQAADSPLRSSTCKPAPNPSRALDHLVPAENRRQSPLGADVYANGRPWYSHVTAAARARLFDFIEATLLAPRFNPELAGLIFDR